MPTKETYQQVKNFIEKESNGECILLSTEYISRIKPLKLKCKCGKEFCKTYKSIKTNKIFCCQECYKKILNKKYSYNIEKVKEVIKSKGCEYISGEYINSRSILTLKCKCGNIFKKSFAKFNHNQNTCPECGNKRVKESKMKYDLEKVRNILANKGYTLIDNEYINCTTPLNCICKRGHHTKIIFSQFLNNSSGCSICASLDNRGENHWNYQGGESEIRDYFRKHIKQWKKDVLKKYNYSCALTNSKKDLIVHHITSFSNILDDCFKELGYSKKKKISDYTPEELTLIEEKLLEKHTIENGIVLQRKVHNKFHSIYGLGNNTQEQLVEFINTYYKKQFNNSII